MAFAGRREGAHPAEVLGTVFDGDVRITAGPVVLDGHLVVPDSAKGIVLFAHGSGSSAHSPRNEYVAGVLNQAGLATLLFDLLTPAEERDRSKVFDIELLAWRLLGARHWLELVPEVRDLRIAFFGASTGAGAALVAAATLGRDVNSVVSRGGRPDLAESVLPKVVSPTLLIVGSDDEIVLDLNRAALTRIRCESKLAIVPGATHLFEERNTLEQAAGLARDWFVRHLTLPLAAPLPDCVDTVNLRVATPDQAAMH